MRSRSLFAVALAAALAAPCVGLAAENYGAGVSLPETTPLARVMADPASFEGRTVKVEGVVTAVCSHMGCWMALAPEQAESGGTMMIKVDDGVIVFPVTAKGRRAAAQGVVERVGGAGESAEAAAEHARATGTKADSAASWQIKATGAIVY